MGRGHLMVVVVLSPAASYEPMKVYGLSDVVVQINYIKIQVSNSKLVVIAKVTYECFLSI